MRYINIVYSMPPNAPIFLRMFGMMLMALSQEGEDTANVGVHMHLVHQVYSSPCFFRHSAIGTENFFSISVR
jgi:hypothetical protein